MDRRDVALGEPVGAGTELAAGVAVLALGSAWGTSVGVVAWGANGAELAGSETCCDNDGTAAEGGGPEVTGSEEPLGTEESP